MSTARRGWRRRSTAIRSWGGGARRGGGACAGGGAEGIVHRVWEPLADKQSPPNAYAGKFSTPYCVAAGFVLGHAGLDAFTEERGRDARLLALAGKVRYEIDPDNPYPDRFTGHVRVKLRDGKTVEERQGHMR